MMTTDFDVLFVCVHNSGRSVAAKLLYNDRAEKLGLATRAESAGTDPADSINPKVASALESFGIDVSDEVPKVIEDAMLAADPAVISMGCAIDESQCPAIRMENIEDWDLPDPKSMTAEEIVPLIHEIARRVNTFIQTNRRC